MLTVNILGLLPIPVVSNLFGIHLGGAATGNIWMTATLAVMTMVMMVLNGLRLGGKAYLAHFCPGPLWMAPLLVPVEIIGLIAKVFALAVRLFANMIAGHILLAVLLSFIMAAGVKSTGLGLGVGVLVVAGSVAINFLELFVAFLQAFTLTFLDDAVHWHVGGAAPRRSPRRSSTTGTKRRRIRNAERRTYSRHARKVRGGCGP